MALSIDIISDVVCPWCFIGKRPAGSRSRVVPGAQARGRGGLEVTYHPFELNPDVPRERAARRRLHREEFGARGYSAHASPGRGGQASREPSPSTARAANAAALSLSVSPGGVQGAVKEALMRAFFVDGPG